MKPPFIDDAKRNDRAIRDFEVVCKCETKIVWLKLPSEWTDIEVQRQIDDAVSFYRKYCIELTFEEFELDLAAPDHAKRKEALDKLLAAYQRLAALIPKSKYTPEADLLAMQSLVETIQDLVAGQVGAKTQVVFFLEEWYVRADRDENRISANHGSRWLIGIDRYDRTSQLMLAHELAHGLRKDSGAGDKNKDCALKFARTNGIGNVAKRRGEQGIHSAGPQAKTTIRTARLRLVAQAPTDQMFAVDSV